MPNPAHFNDDFLDVSQVAAWLNITERHVRRLVFENRIPNHKIEVSYGSAAPKSWNGSRGTGEDRQAKAITNQPEPLRLFELVEPRTAPASQSETTTTPSHNETTTLTSSRETPSTVVLRRDADDDVLHRVAEEATLLANAQRQLDEAIDAARAAGHSWRTIGVLSAIPYQTLHRRRHEDRGDASRRNNSP